MKASRYIFLLFLLALPLAAQVNDTYVIPVVGNVPGAFGTRWMSQFSLFNPQTQYPLKVSVTYLPTGGGAQAQEVLITVPPNATWVSDNILAEAFNNAASGSLLVATFPEDNPGVPNDVLSRAFLVISNTFNNSKNGTFGQTIPGVWAGLQDFNTDGISSIAHGIRNLDTQGWRTNIGAVSLGRCSVTMRVSVYDAAGRTLLDRAPFTVPPLGHIQDGLPVQVDKGSIEFWIEDPCVTNKSNAAVVFPYTSTIDQLSGDPTYQTPTLLASAKSLFAKSVVEPTSIGTKITTEIARRVRAEAVRVKVIDATN